jgi:hypothetical protein
MTSGGPQALGAWRFGDQRLGDGFTPTQYSHTASMGITYTVGSLAGSTSALWILGVSRFGDGLGIAYYPRTNTLSLSYTASPSKYSVPMGVTYTIQRYHTSILMLYYLVAPPSRFSINGDSSIIRPDQMTPVLRPVVARTLLAAPVIQGFEGVTWTYSVLQWSEFNQIISHYNPNSPIVTIGFPDKTGTWVLRQAVFHPPVYGEMQTKLIYNVSLSFSILPG